MHIERYTVYMYIGYDCHCVACTQNVVQKLRKKEKQRLSFVA